MTDEFHFRVVDEVLAPTTLDFLNQHFRQEEPIAKALQLSPEDFFPYIKDIVNTAIKHKISVIAFHSQTHTPAGVWVMTDLARDFHPTCSYGAKGDFYLKFLDKAERYTEHLSKEPNYVAHLQIASVAPEFAGKGLGSKMAKESAKLAYAEGYEILVTEGTSRWTQKIYEKYPSCESKGSIVYNDVIVDGKYPFRNIKDHHSCEALVCSLKDIATNP